MRRSGEKETMLNTDNDDDTREKTREGKHGLRIKRRERGQETRKKKENS